MKRAFLLMVCVVVVIGLLGIAHGKDSKKTSKPKKINFVEDSIFIAELSAPILASLSSKLRKCVYSVMFVPANTVSSKNVKNGIVQLRIGIASEIYIPEQGPKIIYFTHNVPMYSISFEKFRRQFLRELLRRNRRVSYHYMRLNAIAFRNKILARLDAKDRFGPGLTPGSKKLTREEIKKHKGWAKVIRAQENDKRIMQYCVLIVSEAVCDTLSFKKKFPKDYALVQQIVGKSWDLEWQYKTYKDRFAKLKKRYQARQKYLGIKQKIK